MGTVIPTKTVGSDQHDLCRAFLSWNCFCLSEIALGYPRSFMTIGQQAQTLRDTVKQNYCIIYKAHFRSPLIYNHFRNKIALFY
jgi:hypothetical protein